MANKTYLTSLQNINWSRGYLFKVRLDGAPAPFNLNGNIGLPVINVEDTIAIGDTFDWTAGIDLLRVPKGRQQIDLTLTFYDDEDGTLEKFFENWFNQVYNSQQGVVCLSEAVKYLYIDKLKSTGEKVFSREYLVFPYGTLMGVNNLESGPRQYQISFVVARYTNPQEFKYSLDVSSAIVEYGTGKVFIPTEQPEQPGE